MSSARPVALVLFLALGASARAATPVPATGVRAFSQLNAKERAELPDATQVTVRGRTTTLGALRAAQPRRAMRLGSAASLGDAASRAMGALPQVRVGATGLVGRQLVQDPNEYEFNALEKKKFCHAAAAAVCLYYPASTSLVQEATAATETDPYLTNGQVCESEGGNSTTDGCRFIYFSSANLQFNPGNGFVYQAKCDPSYWTITVVDPHGVINVNPKAAQGSTFQTGPTPASCVIRVWLTQ